MTTRSKQAKQQPTQQPVKKYVSKRKAARILTLSERTVDRLAAENRLTKVKLRGGRRVAFVLAEVLALLKPAK
jgi:predicted DNA-binding transcriptional regulator AlpA